jgi:hypothetical protein
MMAVANAIFSSLPCRHALPDAVHIWMPRPSRARGEEFMPGGSLHVSGCTIGRRGNRRHWVFTCQSI